MLYKRIYITSFFLLGFVAHIFAICNAEFHYHEPEDLLISFINESSSFDEGTIHYYWDFGDGAVSYETNPEHLYSEPGIYKVGLSIITSDLCYDRIVHNVYAGIPQTSPFCNLDIYFETTNATSPEYNDGSAYVYAYSEIPCCYYAFWSNGMEGEYITDLEPGTYCVTLSNGEDCYGTSCVNIGYNNNCTSSFLIDSLTFSHLEGAYRFINNSHGEVDYYHWDFGDGQELDAHSPLHIYDEPGTYNVCLEVHTLYDCTNVFCQEITVGNTYPMFANLYGNIYAGNSPLPQGTAVLYKVDNNNFTALDYSLIQDGEYTFNDLSKDYLYMTHLIPYFNTDDTYFPKYFSTYNNNVAYWQDNSYINLYTDTILNTQLLSYNEIFFDEGQISGKVLYNDLSSYETEVFAQSWILPINPEPNLASNMVVLLKNNNHKILDSKLTDSRGEFLFKDLEFGDYYLSIEKAGILSDELFVSITKDNPENHNNDFNINQSSISGNTSSTFFDEFTMYPNPCIDKILLEIDSDKIEKVELISSDGKIIDVFINLSASFEINTSCLFPGVYTLKIFKNNTIFVKSFIKL